MEAIEEQMELSSFRYFGFLHVPFWFKLVLPNRDRKKERHFQKRKNPQPSKKNDKKNKGRYCGFIGSKPCSAKTDVLQEIKLRSPFNGLDTTHQNRNKLNSTDSQIVFH